MKSKPFKKKLDLNKTTLVNLNHHQMNGVYGGIGDAGDEPVVVAGSGIPIFCPVKTGYQCLTDPPTMCISCPAEAACGTVY